MIFFLGQRPTWLIGTAVQSTFLVGVFGKCIIILENMNFPTPGRSFWLFLGTFQRSYSLAIQTLVLRHNKKTTGNC